MGSGGRTQARGTGRDLQRDLGAGLEGGRGSEYDRTAGGASGAEKTTRTGLTAVTGSALLPGEIDSTRSDTAEPAPGPAPWARAPDAMAVAWLGRVLLFTANVVPAASAPQASATTMLILTFLTPGFPRRCRPPANSAPAITFAAPIGAASVTLDIISSFFARLRLVRAR